MAFGQEQVALAGVGDVIELAVDVERHELVVARLDLVELAFQGGDLAAALGARHLVRLVQHAGDLGRQGFRHLDVGNRRLELPEQLRLGHVDALGVDAMAVGAAVVVVALAAGLGLRVVGDAAAALRAREEARERSRGRERRAVVPAREGGLEAVPLVAGEYRLVLAAVALVAPGEPAGVELVLEDGLDVPRAEQPVLPAEGGPEPLGDHGRPDRF
ncbi:MAG: hypothetical protein A2Z17_01225 [Gammaproteobacteria bacterium RBG_16_66_13]|nr:MAG: hypothetical protein A2Z17_01225 [Gammaproteobacteria bacterium RBG_16_66_13]